MRGAMRSLPPHDHLWSGTAKAEFGRFHSEAPRDAWSGAVLKDRYSLIERLGSGGDGIVYLASDRKEGRMVAVKLIGKIAPAAEDQGGLLDLSDHFRFLRQLRACGSIDHPNLVKVLDSGVAKGVPFVVMERLEGEDLQKAIRRQGALGWPESKGIILQACDGLKALHERGMIHRDIKPSNIFLTRDGAKIIDFDLVKSEGGGAVDDSDSGDIVGTPAYMAPEMLGGGAIDRRLDIYSLGATIYEMLAGIPPFTARSYLELMIKHRDEIPRPINAARLGANVPPGAERLVARCLEKDPRDRFQTVDELRAAVESAGSEGRKGPISRAWAFLKDLAGILGGKWDPGSFDIQPWDVDPLGR